VLYKSKEGWGCLDTRTDRQTGDMIYYNNDHTLITKHIVVVIVHL